MELEHSIARPFRQSIHKREERRIIPGIGVRGKVA